MIPKFNPPVRSRTAALAEPESHIAERQARVKKMNRWTREDKVFWGGLAAFVIIEAAFFIGVAWWISNHTGHGL